LPACFIPNAKQGTTDCRPGTWDHIQHSAASALAVESKSSLIVFKDSLGLKFQKPVVLTALAAPLAQVIEIEI
jgi:hypothetical protein